MPAALVAALPLIQQLLGLVISKLPDLAAEAEMAVGLINQQDDVTADQQAAIDAALDKVKAQIDAA